MLRNLILFSFLWLLFSCYNTSPKEKNETNVIGDWYIDEMYYDTINYRNYLKSYRIKINNDFSAIIPNVIYLPDESTIRWKKTKKQGNVYLKFYSKNSIFNKEFIIIPEVDEEYNRIILESDSISIKLIKDEEINIIPYY